MFKQAQKRVGTGTLNRVLREAVDAHPPVDAARAGTPRIYYATQVGTAPPTVVLFVNHPSLFDATYQRYLLNVFREKLPFHDIPIKLYLRRRTQSDPNAPSVGRRRPDRRRRLPRRASREPAHAVRRSRPLPPDRPRGQRAALDDLRRLTG